MSTVKIAATALLAFAFLTQVSVAAMAEDSNSDDDSTSFISPTSRPINPAPNERRPHGDRPKIKEGEKFQVAVPPMVITPDADNSDESGENENDSANPKKSFKVSPPKNGASVNSSVPDTAGNEQVIEPNSAAFDPNANKPIEMQNIRPNKKTPADVFIESAQIGVGAMAAGAVVLGVTAAVRGVRFRKQTKTDFIYEVDAKE
jgi:hypothetical protein